MAENTLWFCAIKFKICGLKIIIKVTISYSWSGLPIQRHFQTVELSLPIDYPKIFAY